MQPALKQKVRKGNCKVVRLQDQPSTNSLQTHQTKNTLLTCSDGAIMEFDMEQKSLTNEFKGCYSLCAYSADSVVGAYDNVLEVMQRDKLFGHLDKITKVQCDDQGVCLTAAADGLLMLWSITDCQLIERMHFHTGAVTDFLWRNSLVVSGDSDGQLSIWDLNKCRVVNSKRLSESGISHLACYADFARHNVIAASCKDAKISFLDMRSNKLAGTVTTEQKDIGCMKSNISGYLFVGGLTNKVQVVDICSGFRLQNALKIDAPACSLELFENFLLVGTNSGTLSVCDTDMRETVYSLKLNDRRPIDLLQFSQNRSYLVAGSYSASPCLIEFA